MKNVRTGGKTEAQEGEALSLGHTAGWRVGQAASSDCIPGPGIYYYAR